MRLALALLIFAATLLTAASAQAEGRWRAGGPNRYYQRSAYAAAVYPKYQAGFHSRHLQNIGIPSGDIGLRGNSIFLNPW
jgi:hypothetical protein